MQLSILEEAEALLKLKNDFLMSNESVALMIGKPRTTITNLIRLASNLTVFGKELLERGDVEYGHIRCVLTLPDDDQNTVLNHVLEKKLSVRATEKLVSERAYKLLTQLENNTKPEENALIYQELEDMVKNYQKHNFKQIKFKILANGSFRVFIDFNEINDFKKMLID